VAERVLEVYSTAIEATPAEKADVWSNPGS
jgi:hypothetical protein